MTACCRCGGEIVSGAVLWKESYTRSLFPVESDHVEHKREPYCQACADAERADMWDPEDGPCPYQVHPAGRA